MHSYLRPLLIAILFSYNSYTHTSLNNDSSTPQPSFISRFWSSIFGSSASTQKAAQTCENCKNGNGTTHIEHAHLTQGSGSGSHGSSGSPTVIANVHGNLGASTGGSSGGMSEHTILALEKEKTRQLELANAQRMLEEHERNRWFNTLVQFLDKRFTEEREKDRTSNKAEIKELLDYHHGELRKIGEDHNKALVEQEEVRQKGLPKMLAHDLEKTELEHKQALEKLTKIGYGIYTFLGDRQRLMQATGLISCSALGIYGAKRGTGVMARYASATLMKPRLVTETSRLSVNQLLRHPLRTWKQRKEALAQPTYNEELQRHVDTYVNSIKASFGSGQPFRHALLYGNPGTGKTLLAKTIARSLGMPYAIVPGSNIHQFNDQQSIEELNKLFDWAERGKKPTVVFFDECDALAPDRENGHVGEQSRRVQNALYARTGTETARFLMLGATNLPKLLDPAFRSRFDEHIKFDLPDLETREKLLKNFAKTYATKSVVFSPDETSHDLAWLAQRTEGFSGRELSQLVRSLQAHALTQSDKTVNRGLMETVVDKTLKQRDQLKSYSSK